MKKKLVAFAVTAAMVITSAVPALAWSDDVTKVDYTKNQIVVDKTVNSGGGIVETAVAGGITDSKTFTTTVDLNRIAGQFEYGAADLPAMLELVRRAHEQTGSGRLENEGRG